MTNIAVEARGRVRQIAAGALAVAVVFVGLQGFDGRARAAAPPYEPDPHADGTLSFFNSSGQAVTGGNINDAPFAVYVQASTAGRSGDTKATLFGYLPKNGVDTGAWSGEQMTLSVTYPDATAPAPLNGSLPLVKMTANDTRIADLVVDFPNTATDEYKGLYQLRIKTSGEGQPAGATYKAADIYVDGQTWTQVYPTPSVTTTTSTSTTTTSPSSTTTTSTTPSSTTTSTTLVPTSTTTSTTLVPTSTTTSTTLVPTSTTTSSTSTTVKPTTTTTSTTVPTKPPKDNPCDSPTIVGTGEDDTLRGTDGPDVIDGFDGDDTIYGLGGDDIICGRNGDDVIYGGDGDDYIFASRGDDTVKGDNGRDRIFGGAGWDTLSGNNGNDRLHGNGGRDQLSGGNGEDSLFGDEADDTLAGNNGDDALYGDEGNNDSCVGGHGTDSASTCENVDGTP
ncbi:MAG: hypothetical protein QOI61_351 [Actinomycetota bacterium]